MKIYHNIVLLVSILLSINLYSQAIKGSGTVKTDMRDVQGFKRIIAQGNFNLILIQNDKEGLRIETDDNIIELFQTRMEDNTLFITMLADIRRFNVLNVYVSAINLNEVVLLNQVSLKSEGLLKFPNLNLFSCGMSNINTEIETKNLSIDLADGSACKLKGKSENLQLRMHEDTELNAFELEVHDAEIISTGFAEVMVNVSGNIQITATGESNVYYIGNPIFKKRIHSSTGFIVKRKNANEEMTE